MGFERQFTDVSPVHPAAGYIGGKRRLAKRLVAAIATIPHPDLCRTVRRHVVRRAFAALGHDAWSCDLLPAEDRTNKHIVADARSLLYDGWDLIVAHPPCTLLCNSGVLWLSQPPKGWKERSRFFPGIAAAMADQWCGLLQVGQLVAAE